MISDTYMDVLEGRLALSDIQKGAKASTQKAFSEYGSRWGALSLDTPVVSGAKTTFGDNLADPAALAAFDQDEEDEW